MLRKTHATEIVTALVLTGAICTPALASVFTIGTATDRTTNPLPFGPGSTVNVTDYQQIYAASAFPGGMPLNISSIGFESGAASAGSVLTEDVQIALGYTSSSTTNPLESLTGNITSPLTTVFDGSVTTTLQGDGSFDLVFPTNTFSFNPADGNLLMNIVFKQPPTGTGSGLFMLADAGAPMARIFNPTSSTVFAQGGRGLVTQFDPQPAPEASSLVSFMLGLIAIGGLCFRFANRPNTPLV